MIEAVDQLAPEQPAGAVPCPTPEPELGDSARLAPAFTGFDNLLKKNSFSARKQFSILRGMVNDEKSRPLLEQIEDSLGCLDFKEARNHLASLARYHGVSLP